MFGGRYNRADGLHCKIPNPDSNTMIFTFKLGTQSNYTAYIYFSDNKHYIKFKDVKCNVKTIILSDNNYFFVFEATYTGNNTFLLDTKSPITPLPPDTFYLIGTVECLSLEPKTMNITDGGNDSCNTLPNGLIEIFSPCNSLSINKIQYNGTTYPVTLVTKSKIYPVYFFTSPGFTLNNSNLTITC
jgi:hypothetical protein